MINNVYWRSTPQLINHGLAKSGVDMNRYMGIFHRQMGTYWDFVKSGDGNNDDICAGVPVGNRQVGLVRFNVTRVYGIYIIYRYIYNRVYKPTYNILQLGCTTLYPITFADKTSRQFQNPGWFSYFSKKNWWLYYP